MTDGQQDDLVDEVRRLREENRRLSLELLAALGQEQETRIRTDVLKQFNPPVVVFHQVCV